MSETEEEDQKVLESICRNETKFKHHYNNISEDDDDTTRFRRCSKCNTPTMYHSKPINDRCDREFIEEDAAIDIEDLIAGKDAFKVAKDKAVEIERKKQEKKKNRTCDICEKDFKSEAGLTTHVKKVHKEPEPGRAEPIERLIAEMVKDRRYWMEKDEKMTEQIGDARLNTNQKITEIPKWEKDQDFQNYKKKVQDWAKFTKLEPELKLQELLKSLGIERKSEKQRIEHEIYTKNFDRSDKNGIEKCLKILEDWCAETTLEKTVKRWDEYKDFKIKEGESIGDHIRRFEIIVIECESLGITFNPRINAIQLYRSADLTKEESKIVQLKMKQEDDQILDSVKATLKDIRRDLSIEPKKTNAFFAGRQSRHDMYKNNVDESEHNNKPQRYRSRSTSRHRSRSENGRRNFNNFPKRQRSSSFNNSNGYDKRQRSGSGNRIFNNRNRSKSHDELKKDDRREGSDSVKTYFQKGIFETKSVNFGIVDGGCPSTVAGRSWVECYIQTLEDENIETQSCKENFQFGPSAVYTARTKVILPIKLGSKSTKLGCFVVDCDIPLLVSESTLENWGAIQDHKNKTLNIDHGGWSETINMIKMPSGHSGLDLSVNENEIIRRGFFASNEDKSEFTFGKIKKIHRVLAHKKEEKMISLFRNKGNYNKKVEKIIKKVCSECKICMKYRRNTSRPKVGLPKATTPNEVVSVDLKNVSTIYSDPSDKRFIL